MTGVRQRQRRSGQDQLRDEPDLQKSGVRFMDIRFALVGGAVAALTLFGGVAIVGGVTPYESLSLINAVLPTIRFLASSVMAAGTTILALMLTLLGITYTTEWTFSHIHYRRLKQISLLASVSIVLSVVILLFLGLPVDEADGLRLYHNIVYYGLTGAASILGGLMVAIVLMLHRTISGLIAIGHPTAESELIEAEARSLADVQST